MSGTRVGTGKRRLRDLQRGGLFAALVLASGCGGQARNSGGHEGEGPHESSGGAANRAGTSSSDGGSLATVGGSAVGGSAVGGSAQGGATATNGTCAPGRAPLRRLTRAEYISSLTTLFGDVADVAAQLPEEARSFPIGNWAENQSVGPEQAAAYARIAKQLAERATRDSEALGKLSPCAARQNPDRACAQSIIETLASNAYRRALTEQELDELFALHTAASTSGATFAQATAAVIRAILQAPDFLYRVEWGTGTGPRPDVRRLSGDEMASRLSYLFWGTSPDEGLRKAARSGALNEPKGIAREAERLLDDPRSRAGLAAFFDDFLALYQLPELSRTDPDYSPELGTSLGRATQRFLEAQIFDKNASWPEVLTADKAFVNGQVASVFGVAGITGDEWQEVKLDPTQRRGLLTQPSVLMIGQTSDSTNPSRRGYRIMEKVLCRHVPPDPPGVPPTIPAPPSGPVTTRQIWALAISNPSCLPCHRDMDQLGFALENFDAIGRYRSQQQGLSIDASVEVTGLGPTNGPVELVNQLASLPETQACFATRFTEFSLGKSLLDNPADTCLSQDIARRFEAGGFNLRRLLLDLTQTDAFLYLPKDRGI